MKSFVSFCAASVVAATAWGSSPPLPPAPPPAAQGDPMEGRYGNMQVMTEKDGKVMKARFNRDKTVELTRPDGNSITGTWELEGEQLCIKMSMLLMSMKRCMPFVPHKKPGDVWTQKNPNGEDVSATIVAGQP